MSDERQPAQVNVDRAQGVIIGDGAAQYNLWLKERELDARRVEALAPPEAARYVAQLSAEDAATVLATATTSASVGVLRVLLSKSKSENLAAAIIARINRTKARELVASIGPAAAKVALLPDAADAIAGYEDTGTPELGEPTGEISLEITSPQGTRGYYQNFQDGQINWSVRSGAQPTRGANAVYHRGLGGSAGRLGFPVTPDSPARPSPFRTDGTWQRFESTWNYDDEICKRLGVTCGATVYWSGRYGSRATWCGIGEHYEQLYGCAGWLGFPVSDEVEVGPSHRRDGAGTTGWHQRFEGGFIYYSDKTKAAAVPSAIAEYHEHRNGVASSRGFPVSRGHQAAKSRYGTSGHYQRFEGTADYPEDILREWSDGEGPGGATVYTSDAHGTYCVGWGNGVLYESLGGTRGWLGFPTSDEKDAWMSENEPWNTIQEFEGGAIFFKEEHGSVAVTRATVDYLAGSGLLLRIGFPVKRENPLTNEDDDPVQFFEHGVVTVRKGVIEAWLRPAEAP